MDGLIWLAVVFLVLALIAYVLGARGIAGFSMEIAKWLVIIFVILAVLVVWIGLFPQMWLRQIGPEVDPIAAEVAERFDDRNTQAEDELAAGDLNTSDGER